MHWSLCDVFGIVFIWWILFEAHDGIKEVKSYVTFTSKFAHVSLWSIRNIWKSSCVWPIFKHVLSFETSHLEAWKYLFISCNFRITKWHHMWHPKYKVMWASFHSFQWPLGYTTSQLYFLACIPHCLMHKLMFCWQRFESFIHLACFTIVPYVAIFHLWNFTHAFTTFKTYHTLHTFHLISCLMVA